MFDADNIAEIIPFIKEVTLVLFWIAVTLTIVSLVDYLVKNKDVMKE